MTNQNSTPNLTETQQIIRSRAVKHVGWDGVEALWSPLSGKYITSAYRLEAKGYGKVVTAQVSRRPLLHTEFGTTPYIEDYWFVWSV